MIQAVTQMTHTDARGSSRRALHRRLAALSVRPKADDGASPSDPEPVAASRKPERETDATGRADTAPLRLQPGWRVPRLRTVAAEAAKGGAECRDNRGETGHASAARGQADTGPGSAEEDDFSRLIAKANRHLAAPDSLQRRNALAHLRAAMAARGEETRDAAPRHDRPGSALR